LIYGRKACCQRAFLPWIMTMLGNVGVGPAGAAEVSHVRI
jgi:hypothetical protein